MFVIGAGLKLGSQLSIGGGVRVQLRQLIDVIVECEVIGAKVVLVSDRSSYSFRNYP